MAVARRMTVQDYERFVMTGVKGAWELHDGVLAEKPGMSWDHGRIIHRFARQVLPQLDEEHEVRFNEGRALKPDATIYIPDLPIVPVAYGRDFAGRPVLAIFSGPLPLVVEVGRPRREPTTSIRRFPSTSSKATGRFGGFMRLRRR